MRCEYRVLLREVGIHMQRIEVSRVCGKPEHIGLFNFALVLGRESHPEVVGCNHFRRQRHFATSGDNLRT